MPLQFVKMEQDTEKRKGDRSEKCNEEKWVYDGSLDYKGRVPLRASTGAWKASIFVISKISLVYFMFVATLKNDFISSMILSSFNALLY